MEMQINAQEIMSRLTKIQSEVNFLIENVVDEDCILDEDDKESLRLAEEEYKNGETISLEELEKELGMN